jgi:hypothetical protein
VFQEGHFAAWVGLAEPTGSVFPIIPLLDFCIVFGLSMDYEVILSARVAEARRSGLDVVRRDRGGLARTATVITSAAAIMVVVFAGFALGAFLPIRCSGSPSRRGADRRDRRPHGDRPALLRSRAVELVAGNMGGSANPRIRESEN